jgi:ferredoxin-NADP reductase
MGYREFTLAKIEEVAEGVRIFTFEGKVPPYKPGNFFLIRLEGADGKMIFRPFSAASHQMEPDLRFCVKKNGAFTELLWKLRTGDAAEIDGPYGIFTLDDNDSERVFIAGGTGIAPLRGMIMQTLLEEKRASLFHSASTTSGLVYSDEMRLFQARNPGFRFFPAVTRQEMPHDWEGMQGRLTADAIAQKLGSLSGKTFYLCGPKEMIGSLVAGLTRAGVPKEKIRKEEWG